MGPDVEEGGSLRSRTIPGNWGGVAQHSVLYSPLCALLDPGLEVLGIDPLGFWLTSLQGAESDSILIARGSYYPCSWCSSPFLLVI